MHMKEMATVAEHKLKKNLFESREPFKKKKEKISIAKFVLITVTLGSVWSDLNQIVYAAQVSCNTD